MIQLAHNPLVPGGPGLYFGVVALGLVAMAVFLFVKKGPPRTILTLVAAAIAIGIGSVATLDASHDVTISITAPVDGATLPAGPIEVRVVLTGASLSSTGGAAHSGHLHLSVDGEVVSMTGGLTNDVTLSPGDHTIEAEFVAADHRSLSPRVVARAEVTAQSQ